MNIYNKKHLILTFITLSLILSSTSFATAEQKKQPTNTTSFDDDLDPLVDVTVTVEIQKIRSLEKLDMHPFHLEKIDWLSKPDFYVIVFINGQEFKSDVWKNTYYVYDPQWSATCDVPDDEGDVEITIQLWDWNLGLNRRCDISGYYERGLLEKYDVNLIYNITTGHWYGTNFDDYTTNDIVSADPSGYGRLNGCDDGSQYKRERDCELWFDIYQNDYDGDNIPYWTEVHEYGTDPTVDNTGDDTDNDGVPIEWEHKWGIYYHRWHRTPNWIYHPLVYEDHRNLDPDLDGLDNWEEYMTSQWGSDPFRKDLFVELDQMEDGPNGQRSILPDRSKELLRTSYNRQNVVYHLDDGCMGGSDWIPFEIVSTRDTLSETYYNYFLHGDENNWRRGVFHYGLVVYDAGYAGYVFSNDHNPYLDSYQISSKYLEERKVKPKTAVIRSRVYASVYMHECGHTLGIFNSNTPGCDDQLSKNPFQLDFYKWRNYKSCMNYRYTYRLVDYSDGTHGINDFDDWNRIDLTYFQRPRW